MKETGNSRYRICRSCGNFSRVDEGQIYCVVCGEKLIEKCPNCSAPIIYPTGRFCHKCGNEYRARKSVE